MTWDQSSPDKVCVGVGGGASLCSGVLETLGTARAVSQ